jgi:hypothetical protein
MTILSKEDLAGIVQVEKTLGPNLTLLEGVVKQFEKVHGEENAYKNLNMFANKIYHTLPDFTDSMIGLIGSVASYVGMLTKFEIYKTAMRQEMEEDNKIEILETGFQTLLPNLMQFTQEIKKYLPKDSDDIKLCDAVLTDLIVLKSEVEKLQKKYDLVGEEKMAGPSSPSQSH